MNTDVIAAPLRPGRVERVDSHFVEAVVWIGEESYDVKFAYNEGYPASSIRLVEPHPCPQALRERLEAWAERELVDFANRADRWRRTPEGQRAQKGSQRAQHAVEAHVTDPFARGWLAQGIARAAANPDKIRRVEQRTVMLEQRLSARHLALLVASFTEEFDEQRFDELIRMVESMPVDGLPGA